MSYVWPATLDHGEVLGLVPSSRAMRPCAICGRPFYNSDPHVMACAPPCGMELRKLRQRYPTRLPMPDAESLALGRLHEGLRLRAYKDTVGVWTIGYGHNLEAKSIRKEVAELLLLHDMEDAERELYAALPWATRLDPVRRAVLLDMSFNLGIAGLLGFRQMLADVQDGRYSDAVVQMGASKWAKQVKGRASRLMQMMATGEWPAEVRR